MKSERLIAVALLAPAMFLIAQQKDPDAKPAEAPVPQQAAAPVAQAVNIDANTYVIGPSDTLTVSVWKEPTLSSTILVRPDGMISMPLLGDVQASGLTPLKLAAQIQTGLKKYLQDPLVSVVMTQINSKRIYFLGEVSHKGPMDMTPGMTLLEAIASAGGLSDFANAKRIYILRDEEGKHLKIPVHYKDALKGNSSLDIALKPGDTLVVP